MTTVEALRIGQIGAPRRRTDATAKVTGRAEYTADVVIADALHGRLVLSLYAHARILSVDTSAALAMPGVHSVLLHEDLPIKKATGRSAEPLAREEVVFYGQPVALVLADTEAQAEDAVEAVVVEYESLEAVVDLRRAIEPGAPPARIAQIEEEAVDVEMHGAAAQGEIVEAETTCENIINQSRYANGDADAALAGSAAVAHGRFVIPWVHQSYLEPQSAIAWPEGDGGLGVVSSTQATFFTREVLAGMYDLPVPKVRVQAGTLGGGFGGKFRLIEPLVAGAALVTRRPVRLVFTRSEDFAAANPMNGFEYDLELGADADGRFTALKGRILVDCGGFTDTATYGLAGTRVAGPYYVDTWRIDTVAVRTNRFGPSAYRGPTATQSAFAVESLIEDLSERLGIDPVELRLRNAPEAGAIQLDGNPWPQTGFREVVEAVRMHPLWQRRHELPEDEGVGLGLGMFPGSRQGATAVCRMDSDGGLTVITGYVDMTGTDTAVQAIAADTFGVSADDVRVVVGDTASAPHAGVSGGSMVTYCLGNAVMAAAKEARQQVLRLAAQLLEVSENDLEIAEGQVRPRGVPDLGILLTEIAAKVTGFGPYMPIEGHGTALPPELSPSIAGALARVRVDQATGRVELLEYVAAQDCGRAVNPALVQGQMCGGAAQSIGFALFEDLAHDEEGQLLANSFLTYALPRAASLPSLETVLIEVPSPHGPLGARGVGESAMAPGAAAVANAVAAATGRKFLALPLTPARVWQEA